MSVGLHNVIYQTQFNILTGYEFPEGQFHSCNSYTISCQV